MMVHVSNTPIPLVRIFDFMRAGDIATHILNGRRHGILDGNGRIRPGRCMRRGHVASFWTLGMPGRIDLNVGRAGQ